MLGHGALQRLRGCGAAAGQLVQRFAVGGLGGGRRRPGAGGGTVGAFLRDGPLFFIQAAQALLAFGRGLGGGFALGGVHVQDRLHQIIQIFHCNTSICQGHPGRAAHRPPGKRGRGRLRSPLLATSL